MSMVIHAYESEHFLTESIADIEIPSSHLEEIDYFFKILNLDRNLNKSKTLFSNEIVDLGLDLYDGFLSRKRILNCNIKLATLVKISKYQCYFIKTLTYQHVLTLRF